LSDAVRNASAFIFISHHTHEEFERHFPGWLERKKLPHRVVHLGARESRGMQGVVENEKDYWLFVGTVEPRKNLDTLIKAHEIYWSRSAAPRKLLIAGGRGWHSEQVHQEIERRTRQDEVSYRGYVSEGELEALYEHARAVVYPSHYEGFGLPILEAMQRGVPVICSRTTSHPEVGGDAVEYFNAWSPEELADKMLDLESSELKRRLMGDRSRERAGMFSWRKTAAETLEFYREVIDRSPKR
jgi:glycosyltransferase involved in cell wall biosynthesis